MIQELFFTPYSQSRSKNQMNTSVTLRYDTKTEKLQLVDVFGKVKNISIDTTPDIELEDLSTIINKEYIESLGFKDSEESAALVPKYGAGWGLGVSLDDTNTNLFFVKKDVMSTFFINCLSGNEETQQNVKDIINLDYISGLGFRLDDKDTVYSGLSGITVEEIDGVNKIFLEPGFLSATLTGLGFVPHDFDTYYYASGDLLNLTPVEDGDVTKPTFSINNEALSSFISGLLTENGYVNTVDAPVSITAGEGISITVDQENNTNVVALTAHIPVITAGEGISVTETDGDYAVALTAHIPSSINDVWTDDVNSGYIRGLGFALTSELSDTLYVAGPSMSLDTDYSDQNIFNVNEAWLSTFIQSFGYITGAVDTTYSGSDSIQISGDNNAISIKNSWLNETVGPMVITNLTTVNGTQTIKGIVNAEYISGLGFVLANEQQDTTYSAGEGLSLTSTTFSVNTNWLTNKISTFIDENVTSTWLSGTGIAISDTSCVSGMGILIEQIANEDPVWKTQKISVSIDWLTGFLQVYNFDHGILGRHDIAAGNGIGITVDDENKIDTIALTANIPSSLATLDSVSANTNYIAGLGFVLAGDDKDTKYGVVANGGLTIDLDHNFAIDTNWMDNRLSSYAETSAVQVVDDYAHDASAALREDLNNTINSLTNFITSSALPVNVSELENDAEYITLSTDVTVVLNGYVSGGFTQTIPNHFHQLCTNIVNITGDLADTKTNLSTNYAQISAIPVNVSELTNDAGYISEIPEKVSYFSNDKGYVTQSELEHVKQILLQYMNPSNVVSYETIDSNVNAPDKSIFIDTDLQISSNTTFTAQNITVQNLSNKSSFVKFNSTGDVTISNLSSEGILARNTENGNTQVAINTPGRVVITDSTLNQTGYNAIEIGLANTSEPPQSVLIDGVTFNATLNNNAISIFGTADDAVITISNCTFVKVSNALRLSNRTNTKFTVNFVNCEFTEWESGQYAGAVLLQDYTSQTAEEATATNRFGSVKATINFINCTHAGTKIEFSDPSTVCATADANQIVYVYYDKGGIQSYSAETYPKITCI